MTATQLEKPTLRVFLSSALADRPKSQSLRRLLSQQADLRVFTVDELSAGENVTGRVRSEIAECDLFIVLLSPEASGSSWVLSELGAAWGLEKPIVAVVTQADAKLPADLGSAALVRLSDVENAEDVERLLAPFRRLWPQPN